MSPLGSQGVSPCVWSVVSAVPGPLPDFKVRLSGPCEREIQPYIYMYVCICVYIYTHTCTTWENGYMDMWLNPFTVQLETS